VNQRESFTLRAAVGERSSPALVQPTDEIAFEDASRARREFNDGRSFAERGEDGRIEPGEVLEGPRRICALKDFAAELVGRPRLGVVPAPAR
jgi:hypothetical protein